MKKSANPIVLATMAAALVVPALFPTPAFAVNKDMVQLQTEVQQLSDAISRLQLSHDKDMGMLTELMRQTADSINKMNANMADMQKRVQAVSESQTGKSDQLSNQIQSMNDSIDEMKARLTQFDNILGKIQNQQQSMAANIQNLAPAAGGGAMGGGMPGEATPGGTNAPQPSATTPPSAMNVPATARPTRADAPSAKELYETASSDYNTGKYPLAEAEFNDVIRFYPSSDLAGSAHFYVGEIAYRDKRYAPAIQSYDKAIELSSDNSKIRAAHLHKADALAKSNQTEAAQRELRALIGRFPNTNEAHIAQQRLTALNHR